MIVWKRARNKRIRANGKKVKMSALIQELGKRVARNVCKRVQQFHLGRKSDGDRTGNSRDPKRVCIVRSCCVPAPSCTCIAHFFPYFFTFFLCTLSRLYGEMPTLSNVTLVQVFLATCHL